MVNGLETEGVNKALESFSIEKILSGDLSLFIWLFSIILLIAIYSIIIYHFYRYIARRNCFKPSERKHSKTVGFFKYVFLFPFIAFLFFMGFSLMLIFLTKNYEISQIMYTSFALVVAIRITAYYTEDLSKDVAKMLPFAILGVFLVDSSYFSIKTVTTRLNALPDNVNYIVQFLILIIFVEWILRSGLFIKNKILPKKETDINQK